MSLQEKPHSPDSREPTSATCKKDKCFNFFLSSWDADASVTSYFISPVSLLVVRSVFTLYTFITIILSIYFATRSGNSYLWMNYFTHISYLSLFVYFLLSSFWSFSYIRSSRTNKPHHLQCQNRFWTLVYASIQQSLAVYTVLVPIIFWTLLSEPLLTNPKPYAVEAWWENISVHALDFVFMFTDLILNRVLLFWPFLFFVVLYLLLYVFWAWCYVAWTGNWAYGFLKFSNGGIDAAYYLGIPVLTIIIFVVMTYVLRFRARIGKARIHEQESVHVVLDTDSHDEEGRIGN